MTRREALFALAGISAGNAVASPRPRAPQKAPVQKGLTTHSPPKPLAAGATTHEWRSFLGPFHNGTSAETSIDHSLSKEKPKTVWEVAKGEGYAPVAVVSERVILFHREGAVEIADCLHAESGTRAWRFAYPTAYQDSYGFSNGPRCQPVTDGKHVYLYGAEGKLHCLLLATGQAVWQRDIMRDYKVKQNFFGVGAAPLIEGDQLIVVVGAEAGPTVVALDKTTGKQRWVSGLEWTAGYAPPVPATIHGSRMLFVFAGGDSRPPTGGLMVIEAESGKTLSTFPWRGRRYESVNCSSPLIVGERVFISECYGRGGALLDVLPSGELRKVWSNESLNTHFMTAIHKNGYLYGVANHGPQNAPLVCVELATGKEMWRQEPEWEETVQTPQGQRKATLAPSLASMLSVAGKCLLLGYFGHLAWLDLDPKGYKELGRKLLFLATETWTPPSLSRGLLYVCQNSKGFDGTQPRLICYDMRGS